MIDSIFDQCVNLLVWLAGVAGVTYKTINVVLFVGLLPLLIAALLWRWWSLREALELSERTKEWQKNDMKDSRGEIDRLRNRYADIAGQVAEVREAHDRIKAALPLALVNKPAEEVRIRAELLVVSGDEHASSVLEFKTFEDTDLDELLRLLQLLAGLPPASQRVVMTLAELLTFENLEPA